MVKRICFSARRALEHMQDGYHLGCSQPIKGLLVEANT
jgi:hypothetical protein